MPENRENQNINQSETYKELIKNQEQRTANFMNRREFFSKFAPRKQESRTDEELAQIRAKLSAEANKFDSDGQLIDEQNPDKKKKKPLDKKKLGRRSLLLGLIGTGAYLGLFKWDYFNRYKHQLERKEYPAGLGGVIESIKDEYPYVDQEADPEVWANEIETAFINSGLPRNSETLGEVLALITAESGYRNVPRVYDYMSIIDEDGLSLVKGARTGGPMELAYQHVINSEQVTEEEARELMKNLPEGLRISFGHLNQIVSAYSTVTDTDLRIKCIFADWNSGLFSSRNAGFQFAINELTGQELKLDGLIGDKSKELVKAILRKKNIEVPTIDSDLDNNRAAGFNQTPTWQAIEGLLGHPIEPKVADTPVLGLYGVTKKVSTGVGTSGEFAEARFEEYTKIRELMAKYKVN